MVSSSRSNELNGDNDDIKSKLMTNFEEFPYVFYRLLITIAKSPWIGGKKTKEKEKLKGGKVGEIRKGFLERESKELGGERGERGEWGARWG